MFSHSTARQAYLLDDRRYHNRPVHATRQHEVTSKSLNRRTENARQRRRTFDSPISRLPASPVNSHTVQAQIISKTRKHCGVTFQTLEDLAPSQYSEFVSLSLMSECQIIGVFVQVSLACTGRTLRRETRARKRGVAAELNRKTGRSGGLIIPSLSQTSRPDWPVLQVYLLRGEPHNSHKTTPFGNNNAGFFL